MIAIIDYGVGNLFSLTGSLHHLQIDCVVTSDPHMLKRADRIILPGVGAFGDAATKLRLSGLVGTLDKQVAFGKPLLGICVGMQLLFERSYEFGKYQGLGYLPGSIYSLADDIPATLKVPQIGWNSLHFTQPDSPLLKYNAPGDYMYFVHSFYAKNCDASSVAYAEYGVHVPAITQKRNVYGTQFHPEKSGAAGLNILKAFNEI